jgi:signal transduction histidine kinase
VTLRRLKWLAIVAPVLFLAALWTLLHTESVLHHSEVQEGVILLGATIAGAAFFAYSVFAVIDRLERRILEQNCELEQRNQELSALLAVGRASSSLELGEVLDKVTAAILETTRADEAEVWLRTESGELALARHHGREPGALQELTRSGLREGLPDLAAESGARVVVQDLASDLRFLREAIRELGFQSSYALPLRHGGETVGVLGVASRDPEKLCSQSELRLLEGIGEQLALATGNARLHARVLDGAVLEERMRIARELHDGLAQVLGYINMQTLAVRKLLSSGRTGEAQDELALMDKAARKVYGDVREAILGLRVSPSRQGLVPALRRYLKEYEGMAGVTLRLEEGEGLDGLELSPTVEIQLMRIVQEALSNVRKHALAVNATVRITAKGGALAFEVIDDGQGFDPRLSEPMGWPRFGLQTMRERAQAIGGRFELDSRPGEGTCVTVRLPLRQRTKVASASLTG